MISQLPTSVIKTVTTPPIFDQFTKRLHAFVHENTVELSEETLGWIEQNKAELIKALEDKNLKKDHIDNIAVVKDWHDYNQSFGDGRHANHKKLHDLIKDLHTKTEGTENEIPLSYTAENLGVYLKNIDTAFKVHSDDNTEQSITIEIGSKILIVKVEELEE